MKQNVTLTVDPKRQKDSAGLPVRVCELGAQSREVEVLIQQLQAWNAIGIEWQNMAVLARQHDILHQLRASCELLDIPVRHQLSGASLRRLVHVRECWRMLEQLRELESQPINQQQMLAMLAPSESATSNGTMRPPLLNRWNHLLRGVINGCWNGLSPEVPVPALQLRSELMDALFEVGREFSLGTGVFLGTVHAAKGLEFDRVLLPSRGWIAPWRPLANEKRSVGCSMSAARGLATSWWYSPGHITL